MPKGMCRRVRAEHSGAVLIASVRLRPAWLRCPGNLARTLGAPVLTFLLAVRPRSSTSSLAKRLLGSSASGCVSRSRCLGRVSWSGIAG
jgi:hypothetical protein